MSKANFTALEVMAQELHHTQKLLGQEKGRRSEHAMAANNLRQKNGKLNRVITQQRTKIADLRQENNALRVENERLQDILNQNA